MHRLEPGVYCQHSSEFSLENCRAAFETLRTGKGEKQILKQGTRRKTYVQLLPVDNEERPILVKEYFETGIWGVMKNWIRVHPSRRAWTAVHRALERCVPTAKPCALIEMPNAHSAYFLSEYLEGWERVDLRIKNQCPDPTNQEHRQMRRKLLDALAIQVRAFHDSGAYQPDFIGGNILVNYDEKGQWHVAFVDLDAARFPTALNLALRFKCLSRLNASMAPYLTSTERLKGLQIYAGDDTAFSNRAAIENILSFKRV